MRKSTLPIVITGLILLSACGVRGDLETPPPLWGDKDKREQTETETPDSN